ncbi:MAG TPA: hypothetical protein VET48_10625, partial [Steroidobacteraceae bacterium]|nr:hypothetical protein [Steroidobacteraceae bacterium]
VKHSCIGRGAFCVIVSDMRSTMMSERQHQTLDEALTSLPSDVMPNRDLWPEIRAEIESRAPRRAWQLGPWSQLAAAVVLMIATAMTTYFLTRQSIRTELAVNSGTTSAAKYELGFDGETLGENYLRARADLDRLFAQRIASLPPAARSKLQNNLLDLRRAADEIAATLAEHPSDSLLQELLLSTRQRELQLLADVSRMPIPVS